MLDEIVARTRKMRPLVHCLTNYVTANDCANVLLACGASPIMAEDSIEIREIAAQCDALVLNLGTPNPRKLRAMEIAGREAARRGRPIVLDPVGTGCSSARRRAAKRWIERLPIAVVRGNADEIAALACGTTGRGVDAADCAPHTEAMDDIAGALARKTGAAVVVTGEVDFVTDGARLYHAFNGCEKMRAVTGTGCQLSALTGAYVAVHSDRLIASLAAVCAMGICGEIANERMRPMDGNASYRSYVIDALDRLTPETLKRRAKYAVE